MRKLLLVFLLIFSSVANAQGVVEQVASNNMGQAFIRLINQSNSWVACYYSDAYNYLTFSIPPNSVTNWQPIYGAYVWQCNFY